MRKKLLFSLVLSGLLLSLNSLEAKTDTKTLVNKEANNIQSSFKQAPKEILEALNETFLAMQSLQYKKVDKAKKYLQEATKKFDKALKKDPSLDLLPIDEQIGVYENLLSIDQIKEAIKKSIDLLKEYKVPQARALLNPLKDEMDIRVTSIPMKLFPKATKEALEALNKKDEKKAVENLAEAFGTLVVEDALLPIPLLSAQDLIIEASLLDKSKKDEAIKLLDAAQDELKRAELLGYTNRHSNEYKELKKEIKAVKKEIKGKNEVEKLYDKLKNSFKSLIGKSKNDKQKSAENKINYYQSKEALKAINEKSKFSSEAKEDETKTLK